MKISHEEAVKIAIEKYGSNEVFVGNLHEVWEEAARRTKQNYLPEPTCISPERLLRLDGVEWNYDTDESWAEYSDSKILTDANDHYYYVLLPEVSKLNKEKITKLKEIECYVIDHFPFKFRNMDIIEILKLYKKGGFKSELTEEEYSEKCIKNYEFLMR